MARPLRDFTHRSIAARLAVMAAAGALFMVLVAVAVLLIARVELVAERTEKAHAAVDSVWNMASGFQRAAESGATTCAACVRTGSSTNRHAGAGRCPVPCVRFTELRAPASGRAGGDRHARETWCG